MHEIDAKKIIHSSENEFSTVFAGIFLNFFDVELSIVKDFVVVSINIFYQISIWNEITISHCSKHKLEKISDPLNLINAK